jgi:hypothetical protein
VKNLHLEVKFHEGGFFSNFNKVTTFIDSCTDNICQITWNMQGQPYGAFAYNCGEVFGKLFVNYNNGELPDEKIVLETYNKLTYTGRDVHDIYIGSDISWRTQLNKTLKYFQPTPFLQEGITKIETISIFNSNSNLIGVLKRNELLKCEQHDNKMPTLEDYFKEIDKFFTDNTYLFLAVDNLHDLNAFIERYKKCIYNTKSRRTQFCTDTEPHFTPGTADDARNVYLDVYALSLCNYFIHPLSNMSTAVLYFKPSIKSIYI